jgi:hypothetical protein
MFAEATCMARVIIDLITGERKTPKNVTKGGGVRMTQTSVPKIHTSREGNRSGGGGGGWVHWVERIGAVTSVEHHPGTGVLYRKAAPVKLNSNSIFTSERSNGDKILNEFGLNNYFIHRKWLG